MTNWMIAGQAPEGFGLDPESQWQSTGDSAAVIRYTRHELSNDAITRHVQAGYQCTRLALTWQDRISFVLTETADCKRINALDILQERANSESGTTPEEKLDSDFMLMTAELNHLLVALTKALGAAETTEGD
jgi:recombination associated protein RdgC